MPELCLETTQVPLSPLKALEGCFSEVVPLGTMADESLEQPGGFWVELPEGLAPGTRQLAQWGEVLSGGSMPGSRQLDLERG